MWLCNTPTTNVAKACNLPEPAQGGWLISVSDELEHRKDVEFIFVLPTSKAIEGISYVEKDRSTYITLNLKNSSDETMIHAFGTVLNRIKPDIIHIWGTEYKHSWAMTKAAEQSEMSEKVVVSIQGLVGMIAKHYMGGIPGKYQLLPSFRDIVRKDTLKKQRDDLIRRGEYEKETLKSVKHVIGRTFWDKACVGLINPEVNYHFNNETLRETFYTSVWKYENCEKHSIFISQSHYPIKGFHYLLEAVAMLKDSYEDINVYISGYDNALKTGILSTAYGKYVQYLIKKYDLSSRLHYLGMLNAEEMKQQFLKSEIFVSPSVIENSPNSLGEAMILGMPIVAANVGGVSSMLVHGKEGYLYQSDAPYLLAYYISQLFDDRENEYELGKNAREHALRTHNKEKNIRELIDIYKNITEER